MPNIQKIAFHDDELQVCVDDRTGKEYVLPKHMVEMLGLNWPTQYTKFMRSQLFRKGITKITMPSAGGDQETLLLERRLVHAWLLSIDIGRVAPALQDKLLRYQEECADVLDAYFSQGHATNPRAALDHYPDLQAITKLVVGLAEARDSAARAEAKAHAAEVQSARAETTASHAEEKAALALKDVHRMTLEDFLGKNGLALKYGGKSQKDEIVAWLKQFCDTYSLPIVAEPVYGKAWRTELGYPLPALMAWLRYEQTRPRQIHLAHKKGS